MTVLRPYQAAAVDWLQSRKRGMVIAPAGAGKTVVAAAAAARKLVANQRALWIANTREQVDQAIKAMSSTEGPEGVEWQVECAAARPDASVFDLVILDEAHHSPAETWSALIESCTGILWGFTATPWHDTDEERNQSIKDTFKEFFTIERDEVMAGGHLVPGTVRPIDLDKPMEYEEEIAPLVSKELRRRCAIWPWQDAQEHKRRAIWQITSKHLQENIKRNAAVVNTARSEMAQGAVVIVLVGSIEHGEQLVEQIDGSAMLHSKLPKKLRTQRVNDLRAGTLRCVVATSLMDEGADFPVASVLILAAAGRSSTKTIQRVGRVMRPHPGKTEGIVYDFVDRGLIFAHAQHKARLRVYRELNYRLDKDFQIGC